MAVEFHFPGVGADTHGSVTLPQIPSQAEKPLLSLGPHRDVRTHFHLVAHPLKGMKKLPLRHGLAKGSVHIPFDEGAPGGFSVLFRLVLGIVFGFSWLGVLDDRETIFPAQGIGGLPHGTVCPCIHQ